MPTAAAMPTTTRSRPCGSCPTEPPSSYDRLEVDLDPYRLGHAFGTNPMPIIFPCHRITRGNAQPSAYVGGSARRAALLQVERDRARA